MPDWSPPPALLAETPRRIRRRRVFPSLSWPTVVAMIIVVPMLLLYGLAYAPITVPALLAILWIDRAERRRTVRLVRHGAAIPATVVSAKPVRFVSRTESGSARGRPGCEVTVRYESGGQILRADARLNFEVCEGDVLAGLMDPDDPYLFALYATLPYQAVPRSRA